jgi:hypothetical protein
LPHYCSKKYKIKNICQKMQHPKKSGKVEGIQEGEERKLSAP